MTKHGIGVLDAGGQYCHLLARRVREMGVPSHVLAMDTDLSVLNSLDGVIISGGPRSVLEKDSPRLAYAVTDIKRPVLGICYGHQLLASSLPGGSVRRGIAREYGLA